MAAYIKMQQGYLCLMKDFVPVGFSTNIGTGIHFVEIGIGASYLKDQVNSRDMLLYYPTLGYRIQFKHSLQVSR